MSSHAVHDHACRRPDVANMDHWAGHGHDARRMVNRYCLTCGTHWYGNDGANVVEIPQRVWDGWMASGLSSGARGAA